MLGTAGAGTQIKSLYRSQASAVAGIKLAAGWAGATFMNSIKAVIGMRKLWAVVVATTCTAFVALQVRHCLLLSFCYPFTAFDCPLAVLSQWGFASLLMPAFLERMYGEGQPWSLIHSINL